MSNSKIYLISVNHQADSSEVLRYHLERICPAEVLIEQSKDAEEFSSSENERIRIELQEIAGSDADLIERAFKVLELHPSWEIGIAKNYCASTGLEPVYADTEIPNSQKRAIVDSNDRQLEALTQTTDLEGQVREMEIERWGSNPHAFLANIVFRSLDGSEGVDEIYRGMAQGGDLAQRDVCMEDVVRRSAKSHSVIAFPVGILHTLGSPSGYTLYSRINSDPDLDVERIFL